MKKTVSLILALLLCLRFVPMLHGDVRTEIFGKKYNLEVRTVDLLEHINPFTGAHFTAMETISTTGRKEQVDQIELKYDFEEQKPENRGKFVEEAPVALVRVDGFSKEMTELMGTETAVIFVDGKELKAEGADYEDSIGWQNLGEGFGVVFPVVLTEEGGATRHSVEIASITEGQIVTEKAEFVVLLTNTGEAPKEEKRLCIVDLECEGAESYLVGNKLYIEHPKGTAGGKKIKMTFAGEDGSLFSEIGWVQSVDGAIALEKETRLKDSAVEFSINRLASQEESCALVFKVETENCWYVSEKIDVVQKFGVLPKVLSGVRFEKPEIVLKVGEELKPAIVEVENGKRIVSGLWYTVTLLPEGDNGVAFSEKDTLLGVRPGEGILRARVTASDGRVYETGSVKVIVEEAKMESYVVSCRKLNVRSGAGTGFAKVGQVTRGTVLEVVSVKNDWAYLSDGKYVCVKYLTKA